jgi:hypothetical protein
MRGWSTSITLLLIAACSSDNTGPGNAPDVPSELFSTTLDRAIALDWTDNAYVSDPANFQNYRVFSTSYNIDNNQCGSSWRLEGTTVAPEFIVGALTNGVSRCFAVSSVSIGGFESARSNSKPDTPRPDARNQVIYAVQSRQDSSGFRFWDDDGDGVVEDGELGRVRDGTSASIDFVVNRDGTGQLFLAPVRPGTGVEFYSNDPVTDLSSIDVAPCFGTGAPTQCDRYVTTPIEAAPGFGYVFEMEASDPLLRYGAVRVTHVGQSFLILDWSFQTDPGNPELTIIRR